MWLLILGLILFMTAHLSPGVFGMKAALISRLGEGRFRGLYVATSVTGMLCLIAGKAIAPFVNIWYPPLWGRTAAAWLVLLGFILFTAMMVPTNLRRWLHHPMLFGTVCWGTGHLLANGDLASMLLFGSFTVFAATCIVSLNKRGNKGDQTRYAFWWDLICGGVGFGAYSAVLMLHARLFGVAAM